MFINDPLHVSRLFLSLMGTRIYSYYQDRVPNHGSILVVSNHRSFMDAPLLMTVMNRSVRFACHHYMGQVPIMRELVKRMGGFPLGSSQDLHQSFFQQAVQLLRSQQPVGIFPEGAEPMVKETLPDQIGDFQRGFAHLALRAPIEDLAILPIAIAAQDEVINSAVPLQLLHLIDPSEPLFNQSGWHPIVKYERVNVLIGRPSWIRSSQRENYRGKQARSLAVEITETCRSEINELMVQGCY